MPSEATITLVKMMETLPKQAQDQVVEHLREYIEELRDEMQWEESFSNTQSSLAATAKQARKEMAEGKASPMDIEKL